MGTRIHQKSVKIQAWTLKCPLLCSPVAQNLPRVPQDAKVKPPIMPNDRFASQKYQDPLATMPRICNPEAMSNDRGPAAEGVAHKIFKSINIRHRAFRHRWSALMLKSCFCRNLLSCLKGHPPLSRRKQSRTLADPFSTLFFDVEKSSPQAPKREPWRP